MTIEEINRAGFMIEGSVKGAGSVLDGLQKLQSFSRIIISDKCPNTYREFKELCFAKDKKTGEILENKFSFDPHSVDSARYGLEQYKHTQYKHGKIRIPRGL